MDRSLIERLAREAGANNRGIGQGGAYRELVLTHPHDPPDPDATEIERFAALVAAECAKVCETLKDSRDFPEGWGPVSEACAAAIRAKFALDSRQPSPSPTTD